jgi:signal peptidase II
MRVFYKAQGYLFAFIFLLLGLAIITVDQFSKAWALRACVQAVYVIPGLSCELSFNRGISCGILHTMGASLCWALSWLVALIAFLMLIYAYRRFKSGHIIIGETLIIAGAIGNLIDRIHYGAVIDFIVIYYKTWYFPTFNIADMAVVIGVIALALQEFFGYD